MANFLHGVETIEQNKGTVPITVIASAVIGLVGIAPEGATESLVLVQSPSDAQQFGAEIPGFTIPQALSAIFDQGQGASVLVVNTFKNDNTAGGNLTAVVDESVTITEGAANLANAPIGEVTVTTDPAGTTYVEGTDYSINEFGKLILLVGSTITEGEDLLISYDKLDLTKVLAAQIIGTIAADVYTGFQLFDLAFATFGFTPRLLIAPELQLAGVPTEMISKATALRAHAILDAPNGKTPTEMIAARGPLGTIEGFNSSSKRAIGLYPNLKAIRTSDATEVVVPYSPYYVGVVANTDATLGYWNSPSNKEIAGITGVERKISAAVNDSTTDTNKLNAVGITTVFNSFGTGIRTWGNRSLAYPASTFPDNFISVRRVADILQQSVEAAALQFVDTPITSALIDSIRGSVNAFINTLVGRDALVDGECTFDPTKNPAEEIAAGHITFDLTFMPPTPAERITFDSFIDITLLNTLTA